MGRAIGKWRSVPDWPDNPLKSRIHETGGIDLVGRLGLGF